MILCTYTFLCIIVAITIPRFAQMLEKFREGSTKVNLGLIKSALARYHGANGGKWSTDLEKDLVPKYVDPIPSLQGDGGLHRAGPKPLGTGVTLVPRGGPGGKWFGMPL